jgi:hypothetical protein
MNFYPTSPCADTYAAASIYRFASRFEDGAVGSGRLTMADREPSSGGRAVSELSIETPDEDAAEQAREVPEELTGALSEVPFETNEADAAEQIRDAGYDEDDYR